MDKKYIIALGIRIAALFYIIYIIRDGSAFVYTVVNLQEKTNWTFVAIIILAVLLLIGVIILKFPLFIAGKLLPKSSEENLGGNYSLEDIQMVAFTIVGLLVLVRAFPDIIYWLIVMQKYKNEIPTIELRPEDVGNIFATILELIIGFWLLFQRDFQKVHDFLQRTQKSRPF